MGQCAAEPTFTGCESAIQEWFAEMAALPAGAAANSRSVFFFSGHGLEVIEDRQLLLPSDYLRPGTPIDRALSTQNLSRGLKALNVPLHFLFLDACRNDHNNLGKFAPLEGTRVLDEPSNAAINPDSFVPIFYGSASGTQALQPNNPALGPSLFGQALLEGLEARGLAPECKSGICYVFLHVLRPYVNNRIAEIVRTQYNSTVTQRVRVRGDQTEEAVTEVPPPVAALAPPPPPAAPEFTAKAMPVRPLMAKLRPGASDFNEAHDYFGSERITDMWQRAMRLYDYGRQEWMPSGDVEVSNLRRAEDTSTFEFDLTIPGATLGGMYWLQVEDEVQALGCGLPIDWFPGTRFRIEMDLPHRERREAARFDVSLSAENGEYLSAAAAMWRTYNEVSARQAESEFSFLIPAHADELQFLVFNKRYSPLAATIAGAILLRARRWDKLKDWLRNLANIAPEIPDAAILRAEQCLRQPRAQSVEEALEYFLRLDNGPLPVLVETLGYALRQAEDFLKDERVGASARAVVERLHQRLKRAVGMFRTGGLIATFAGPKGLLNPDTIGK